MNNYLILQSFVSGLEKIAADRSPEADAERETNQAGKISRIAQATSDSLKSERRRLKRKAWVNAAKPKMFRKKPAGLADTIGSALDSGARVASRTADKMGKRKYDKAENRGRAVAKINQAIR